jgi:hypothetical protein
VRYCLIAARIFKLAGFCLLRRFLKHGGFDGGPYFLVRPAAWEIPPSLVGNLSRFLHFTPP